MADRAQAVDRALDRFLPRESAPPASLHKAMRYSVFAGGKRLRPVLVAAGAEAVGGTLEAVMPAACAVEMIHTYSLIHDDLPAMDNDDFRRGVPTSHKVFGEAIAILAGDALLTLAFRLLANSSPAGGEAGRLRDMLIEVADAAGSAGMVGGQVADIECEGKVAGAAIVDYIHTHKTAALIRASIRSGAILAGASAAELKALGVVGDSLGLAFQIMDDILDITATSEELGKTAGKDQAQQKATYPAVHGIEASRRRAQALVADAHAALAPFGERALPLRALGTFIIERKA
ncbi:MAG TPA: farnesyl diphosphate synthase [Methylomirabilota bacterium]|nr:farnesyl diphosphate synthase [Methylomirabilota bacterium]